MVERLFLHDSAAPQRPKPGLWRASRSVKATEPLLRVQARLDTCALHRASLYAWRTRASQMRRRCGSVSFLGRGGWRLRPGLGLSSGLATSPGVICPFALRYGACATLYRPIISVALIPFLCLVDYPQTERAGPAAREPPRGDRGGASRAPGPSGGALPGPAVRTEGGACTGRSAGEAGAHRE